MADKDDFQVKLTFKDTKCEDALVNGFVVEAVSYTHLTLPTKA